ncbi:hypothetical protein AUEXF2481DRAFT_189218 [Aureobasidium subglaciale EXF-2481]|uniref:Uncharacterized protein n=1 Tax=Aureobasidium subglaciale (strain EXF-2481) TaxID=1043005 RepID=A0A074YZU4_AURSE|nr:uncharacterized protein AUEXF2481DRAFT_189218 [Aureobasidium subglaciale EXF-2481]KAI5195954.1 hypothetical protein E4T38_08811 [Aureobasidium subglaciale]KAI5214886.1 hypothetical protein E4T40_08768 [Aureobasidium subglaciale]KAI5217857.1 hypothetical protein E4T41_08678 [Aureobasidium subglaciale]KAI5255431.1 hypothetical protein E4T46_08712 [Aureobasidium subglaciale]KEQ99647.1 hypothetical protein AUEXF2481DRAFT_189218 [Aureobasidium subglaciale EXF-2481]
MTTSGIPTDSTLATSQPHPEKQPPTNTSSQMQTPPPLKIPCVTYILPSTTDPDPNSTIGPQTRVLRITLKDDTRFDTTTAWNIVWCNICLKQQVGFFHNAGELLWHENGKKWLHPTHAPEIAGLATGDIIRVMRVSKPREDANVIVVAGDT